jgi:hypothetical protein
MNDNATKTEQLTHKPTMQFSEDARFDDNCLCSLVSSFDHGKVEKNNNAIQNREKKLRLSPHCALCFGQKFERN